MMKFADITKQAIAWLAIAAILTSNLPAQAPATATAAVAPATEIALPLPEDRGAAALAQSLKRLGTWASLMAIVAHPDDEDGGMLTYESRGQGVRTSLLTLTRGEGGQNAMSADTYDALGVMRTNELLRAGEFYGVHQYWGTEADFGFSKTLEEAFARWSHPRVLCDTVLAIRRERPLVLTATFIGGVTDGHGQHQVSGEIAQEAFLASGDAKVCPEQIAAGLRPWSPRKVYALTPFAPITEKGMFDYATGKWAPAKFYNYVTKEWSTTAPNANLSVPEGQYDPVLGRTYTQISRQGWGEQKSQNGGGNPTLSGSDSSEYHRYGTRIQPEKPEESDFFDGIPTGLEGLTSLVSGPAPAWLASSLKDISGQIAKAQSSYQPTNPETIAPTLKSAYRATLNLREKVATSQLPAADKADLLSELGIKLAQFQTTLAQALGLDLQAFTVRGGKTQQGRFGPGIDETPRSVIPGQEFLVRMHISQVSTEVRVMKTWFETPAGVSASGKPWKQGEPINVTGNGPVSDATYTLRVPSDAAPTQPYFSRPSIEQPYYDVSSESLRSFSFAPYPLAAWAEFSYEGLPIRIGEVVQTMQRGMGREAGRGGTFQPLVITPQIGLRLEPEARILPLDQSPLPVHVTLHSEGPAEGKLRLTLPTGWTSSPAEADFHRSQSGDSEPILFEVTPAKASQADTAYAIQAQAESAGKTYTTGWQTIGYPGLRPYNLYRKAEMKTRSIDVKVANHLKIGYIMGTGDTVPEAIEGLGLTPRLLTAADLTSGDLSSYDEILIGIRAYSVRPELASAQARLNAYVQAGGTLIVQYQSSNFPAPLPLAVGSAEKVVEETAPVKLLAAGNPLLTTPNAITPHDFDGWVEERGHSFLDSWDAAYTPLTETADAGQDPQRGGLIVAHPGKGTYIYVAYALYRQLPELVPGSYRILANLLSAAKGK